MKLRDKINKLKTAQEEYHKKSDNLTPEQMVRERDKFKKLRADISDTIIEDAKDCPDCGNPPIGMFHDGTPNPFEIGCLNCRDHRVREALPEDAAAKWNRKEYLPPREEGTLVMTKRDATGKTLEERTIKPRGR